MPTLDLSEILSPSRITARAEWPDADIQGVGDWATVAECDGYQTVHLHETEQAAQSALALIDSMGCGGRHCRPRGYDGVARHYLVPLGDG